MTQRSLADVSLQLDFLSRRLGEVERRLGISGEVEPGHSDPPKAEAPADVPRVATGVEPSESERATAGHVRVPGAKAAIFRDWASRRNETAAAQVAERSDSTFPATTVSAQAGSAAPPTKSPLVKVPLTSLPAGPGASESASRHVKDKNLGAAGLQSLERIIGGRWYAVVGAVIVVIGVGLFFRLALQRGWIVFPPSVRCAAGAAFGLALLGAGEWARRKISDWAAVGLSAAGLGVMYTSAYAAYKVFDLVSPGVGFAVLIAVAVLGIGVGARGRLVAVSLVSMIGGYLTPLLFFDVTPTPGVLPGYLLALLAIGLVLAAWRGGSFRHVRAVAWWGTVLEGGAWVMGRGAIEPVAATIFLALVWAGVHAGLALEAVRHGFGPGGTPDRAEDGPDDESPPAPPSSPSNWRTLACSFSTSSWAAVLGVILARQWAVFPDWLVPGTMGAASLWLSFFLAGNLRVFRDLPRTDAQRLGACLAMQAGALVVATVAIGITGSAQVLTWAAMGVAVIAAARWLNSRGLDVYGLIVLSLAAARVVLYEQLTGTLLAAPSVFLGLRLTAWTGVAAGVGVAWGIGAWLIRRSAAEGTTWRAWSNAAFGVALTLLGGSLLDARMSAISAVAIIVTAGIAVAAISRWLKSDGLAMYGVCLLILGSVVPAVRNWGEAWSPDDGLAAMGLRLTAWSGALAYGGAAWLALALVARRSKSEQLRSSGTAGLAVGITLLMGSLLHAGMRGESAIVVGVVAAGLVFAAAAAFRSVPLLAYSGAVLAAVTLFAPTRSWWQSEGSGPSVGVLGLRITAWTGVIAFAGATWLLLAPLARRSWPALPRGLSIVAGGVGLGLALASIMHEDAAPPSLCLAWLVILVVGAAIERLIACSRLDMWAIAGLTVPIIGWASWYPAWGGWPASAGGPAQYEGFWVGMAIAACGALLPRLVVSEQGAEPVRRVRAAGWMVFALVLFGATSLEIGRSAEVVFKDAAAQRAAVSVWWGLFGFAMIVLGFWLRGGRAESRGIPIVRHVGLALLFVATAKAVTFDLASVPPLARAVSFIGLGLLMLAVAVTYGKVAKRVAAAMPVTENGAAEGPAPAHALDRAPEVR